MGFFNFFKRNISEQEFQEQQKMKYGLEKTRTGFFPEHCQHVDPRPDRRRPV